MPHLVSDAHTEHTVPMPGAANLSIEDSALPALRRMLAVFDRDFKQTTQPYYLLLKTKTTTLAGYWSKTPCPSFS
jgi:hypothetical protein